TNVLLASSRVDTALTTLRQRQQEYIMQVANMRSAAQILRLVPLKLMLTPLREALEAAGQRVTFEVRGEETEADQEVVEILAPSLLQLFRSCLSSLALV